MMGNNQMLSNNQCAVVDWLNMAFISGGAFLVFLLLLVAIVALGRYAIDSYRRVER